MQIELLLLEYVRSHYFGKYRGTVTDARDPTSRGRIKVSVPAVLDGVEVWAMPCVPYAGDKVGFYSVPPVGAGVWVEFEGGDPSYAIWSGCFWADGELPDATGQDVKIWKSDSLTIRLDDSADELLIQNTRDSKTTFGDGVVTEVGTKKVEVTSLSVNVNDGALEVT